MKVESFIRSSQHLSNLDLLEIWDFSLLPLGSNLTPPLVPWVCALANNPSS